MNVAEIKAELTSIHNERMQNPSGSHWAEVVSEFNQRFPDARHEVGADMFDRFIKGEAIKVTTDTDRASRTQLKLPGFGEWDDTVTLPDGEGGWRRKRLQFASADDLRADYEIHRENVDRAVAALDRAENRNDALLPTMAEHGFDTAGDAIAHLLGDQS